MPEIDQKVWQEFQRGFIGIDDWWQILLLVGLGVGFFAFVCWASRTN